MINATELRIGNWLQSHAYDEATEFYMVLGITENALYLDGFPCPISISDWKGIPLTPEILGKCGFSLEPHLSYRGLRLSLKFARFDSAEGWLQVDNPFGDITIKSLHQLQNWFYCLTGQELQIDLNKSE